MHRRVSPRPNPSDTHAHDDGEDDDDDDGDSDETYDGALDERRGLSEEGEVGHV